MTCLRKIVEMAREGEAVCVAFLLKPQRVSLEGETSSLTSLCNELYQGFKELELSVGVMRGHTNTTTGIIAEIYFPKEVTPEEIEGGTPSYFQ